MRRHNLLIFISFDGAGGKVIMQNVKGGVAV
jgi:hypothetical protein